MDMKRFPLFLLLSLVLTLPQGLLRAQRTLSLEECRRMAVENDATLSQA